MSRCTKRRVKEAGPCEPPRAHGVRLSVQVRYASDARAPARPTIARWARAALADLGRSRAALGVRIVGRVESAALNRRYRGKTGPTNVLSFPFVAPPGTRTDVLGDLVICAPVVNYEARTMTTVRTAHWAHMIVHGILHLRGYDHTTERQAAIMERKEISILGRLGFPDPYAVSKT